jgi:hypothetical protein
MKIFLLLMVRHSIIFISGAQYPAEELRSHSEVSKVIFLVISVTEPGEKCHFIDLQIYEGKVSRDWKELHIVSLDSKSF